MRLWVWNGCIFFAGARPSLTAIGCFQCSDFFSQRFVFRELPTQSLKLAIQCSLLVCIKAGGVKRVNAVLNFKIYTNISSYLKLEMVCS